MSSHTYSRLRAPVSGLRAPVYKHNAFGRLIQILRTGKGLSIGQLAEKLDTTKSYVCGWETGRANPPSAPFIRRIAKFFRTDVRRLLKLAYAQKAPKEIRAEVERALFMAVSEPR